MATSQSQMLLIDGIKVVIAIFTIVSNLILVFVTKRVKTLHGTCNILIAINSACVALYSLTFFVQFFVALMMEDPKGIPLSQCFVFMSAPIFFVNCQYVLFPMVALDRLLGAFFPIWHLVHIQSHQRRYLFVMLTIAAAYGTYMLASSFRQSIFDQPEKFVLCMTNDPQPAYSSYNSLVLNLASVFLYIILWVRVRLWIKSDDNANNKFTRGILRSLIAIFLVDLFGWATNFAVRNVLNLFSLDPLFVWYVLSIVGFVTILILGLNAPILLLMNDEYQRAFCIAFGVRMSGRNRIEQQQILSQQPHINQITPRGLLPATNGHHFNSTFPAGSRSAGMGSRNASQVFPVPILEH